MSKYFWKIYMALVLILVLFFSNVGIAYAGTILANANVVGGTEGDNGWYKSNVTVRIVAACDRPEKIFSIRYSINYDYPIIYTVNPPDVVASKEIIIGAPGSTRIEYYAYGGDPQTPKFHYFSSPGSITVKIDKYPPIVDSVSGNPAVWQGTDVTLTVTAHDVGVENSGLAVSAYSFDDGATWQTSSQKTFSTNQTVYIKVRDAAGNFSASTPVVISKIDKTAPIISSVAGNPTAWQNTDVTLTVNASDEPGCGLAVSAYSFDNGNTWQSSNQKTFSTNQTVNIKVRDAADNLSSSISVIINKIDKTAPIINSVAGNPTAWQNSDVTLTANADGLGSGIAASAGYSFDNGATWQTSNQKTFATNQTVNIKVRDQLGNTSVGTQVVINKIDKAAPIIDSVTGNPTAWQNTDVTLAVAAHDEGAGGSGLAPSAYSFDNGATWQTDNKKLFSTNQTVNIKVKDAAGNLSATTAVVISKIDKTAPITDSVSGNPTAWQNTDVTLTVNASDGTGSGIAATAGYSFDGGATWQTSNQKTFPENETINIMVRDELGNTSVATSVVISRIDKNTPTIDSVAGNPAVWQNSDVILTVNASDGTGSGIAATAGYSFDDGATWQESNQKTFSENQTVNILVRDVTGNESAVIPVIISKIDKTGPEISIGTMNSGYVLNQNAAISVTVSDNGSGLKSFAVSGDGTYNTETGLITINTSTVGEKTITIVAYDNVENTRDISMKVNVCYNFSGLLKPFLNNSYSAKVGTKVSVKFGLTDANGTIITDAQAKLYIDVDKVDRYLFMYDTKKDQYEYNLDTKEPFFSEPKIYTLFIDLGDGSTHTANLSLKPQRKK